MFSGASWLEADGSVTSANSFRYETWRRPTTTTHNAIRDLGFRLTYVGESLFRWAPDSSSAQAQLPGCSVNLA